MGITARLPECSGSLLADAKGRRAAIERIQSPDGQMYLACPVHGFPGSHCAAEKTPERGAKPWRKTSKCTQRPDEL